MWLHTEKELYRCDICFERSGRSLCGLLTADDIVIVQFNTCRGSER